jgi:dTDP-glucose 4,6-dehydratase
VAHSFGSAACRHLVLEKRWDVLEVDKLTYATNLDSQAAVENWPNYYFVRGDFCDRGKVDSAPAEFAPNTLMRLVACYWI